MSIKKSMMIQARVLTDAIALERKENKEYLSQRQTVSDKKAQICAWEDKIADLQNRLQTATDQKYINRCNEIIADLRFSITRAQEYIARHTR